MAGDKAAHHVRFAAWPERRSAALPRLGFDQPVDDLAALHQQLVHDRVDAVDLNPQISQGLEAGWGGHDRKSSPVSSPLLEHFGAPWEPILQRFPG